MIRFVVWKQVNVQMSTRGVMGGKHFHTCVGIRFLLNGHNHLDSVVYGPTAEKDFWDFELSSACWFDSEGKAMSEALEHNASVFTIYC